MSTQQSDTNESFECNYCDFTTDTKNGISQHHTMMHEEEHQQRLTEELPYECSECNSRFKNQHALDVHVGRVHPNDEDEDIDYEYQCSDCDFETSSEKGMKVHRTRVHSEGSSKKTYECETCGKQVEDWPSRRERGGERETFYCSVKCKDEGASRDWQPKCENCGKDIDRSFDVQKDGNNYCSRKCYGESNRGEDHTLWKSGEYGRLYSGSWESVRSEVIFRDDEQCQRCKISRQDSYDLYNCDLHVHHKTPVREFDDEKDANKKPNLTTLCARCHMKVEFSS